MELKFLLEKYKGLGFSEKRIKELLIEVANSFGLLLEKENVVVKQSEVQIKISGTARAHFTLIKSKFEKKLQEELAKENLKVTKIF